MIDDRVAERVRAASYGSVLVIAALGVTSFFDVGLGYAAELLLGVGAATWIAHLYAELVGRHVVERDPLHRSEVREAMVDGLPTLLVTVVPGLVFVFGQTDPSLADGARSDPTPLGSSPPSRLRSASSSGSSR